MSRIDEALKRITGKPAEPRIASTLERYALEKGVKPEEPLRESRVSHFVPVSVHAADGKVPAAPPPPVPPASIPDQAEPSAEAENLVDFRQLANYARFTFGALGRHKMLASVTFAIALAMTVAAIILLPKTYHVNTKLLAQRNEVMAALSNPGRAVPWDADAPTRAAAETILRRDNLISLARQTDLLNEWDRSRVPILRL